MLRYSIKMGWLLGLLVAISAGAFASAALAADDAESILNARCGACHADEGDGLSRMKGQRKTPEGWLMTIVRMGIMHGVEVPPGEKRALVKYLADTQGLAPSETAPYRYILERQPAHVEDFPPEYFFMCARCHSGARGALQRRTKDEWQSHIHFHLGQWPTTEYQFYGRDREWFDIATTETTDWLAENFPFQAAAWDAWKGHSVDISGDWRWVARGPGVGFQHGLLKTSATGDDVYAVTSSQVMADGSVANLQGNAILYTGYEWRARLNSGDAQYLSIGTVSEDGNNGTGRFMVNGQDEMGLDYVAVRVRDGHSEIMAVEPSYLKAGDEAAIAIHGTGLSGDVDLGSSIEVTGVVSANTNTIVVTAKAASDATIGARGVSVGGTASAADAFVVYDQIAAIKVEPAYTIARVGGGGGTRPDQLALFDAIGYMDGDVRIGVMPANWTVEPFDEVAAELDDVGFAGLMNPRTGIYDPADAGLNPARPFETNNAGNLKVVGTVDDGGGAISGEGQLIVTVQRWNDPPIR
jgi:quinohemoprotein amine dehydrogenase alpha subunit